MYGRLGNQLFRYAAARALQLDYYPQESLVINFNQVIQAGEKDPSFKNYLIDYNVAPFKTYNKSGKIIINETSIVQKTVAGAYYLGLREFQPIQMKEELEYERKWSPILNRVGVYWYRIGYCTLDKSRARNKLLSGSFESPNYFDKYKEQIKQEFIPKKNPLRKNAQLYTIINNTESVCVSIRRGDFETNAVNKTVHSLCNNHYFRTAIKIMGKKLSAAESPPVFIVFSDDIEWARENIKISAQVFYEDGTDPVWEKLRMMSACKHFILSNSTFSWWAQYLSNNQNKIVISPSRWFNNDYESPLINRDWIKVHV